MVSEERRAEYRAWIAKCDTPHPRGYDLYAVPR